jgi:hypothetical protein
VAAAASTGSWLTVPINTLKEYVSGSAAEGLSFSTMAGGSPSSTQGKQFITALQRAGYTSSQIQGFAKGPSELQQILDQIGQSAVITPLGGAGAAVAGGSAAAGDATIAGGGLATSGLAGGGLLAATAAAITSPLDFLKFIAWIFHPRNILRAVEFVVGIILMIFGFHAAMQARGERIEGFTTSEGALTRSGLGRVATALGQATRGGGVQRPTSAPHRTRQRALTQRYRREENLQRRGSTQRADVSRSKAPRKKKSAAAKAATVASRLVE